MKSNKYFAVIIISFLAFFNACKQVPKVPSDNLLEVQVDSLSELKPTKENADSIIGEWKNLALLAQKANDTTQWAMSKYFLARQYAMMNSDSAKPAVEEALTLIEPTKDNWPQKANIYTGMGNVWNQISKEHQANYYYNKAASIVLADTGLDLSPGSKTSMLLSAAQSNQNLYQFELANQMNRAALALVDQLPEDHPNRQRPLSQMISLFSSVKAPADSMLPYLTQLQKLHKKYPGKFNEVFLFDSEAQYYHAVDNNEALLSMYLKKLDLDKAMVASNAMEKSYISNLFITYFNIAGCYIESGNVTRSKVYFDSATQILVKNEEYIGDDNRIMYLNNLSTYNKLKGNTIMALGLSEQVVALQKKYYRNQNIQAVAEMNALYQIQAKDKYIKNLSENIKISELQLQQNKLWLLILVLIGCLLLAFVAFLYYSQKQRKAKQERDKVLLQQQLLRTQMEPHFIFNTLSAVQSFVRFDQKDKAIKYINQFSKLLRSSLELSRENLVPLEDEIEALENYLSLQQMRFDNAFNYTIQAVENEDTGAIMIPPMLIQPYVENAILHGIDLQNAKAHIDISLKIEGTVLQVVISDNGNGSLDKTKPLHRSLSGEIGKERLKFLGKLANVSLEPNAAGGTTVSLQVPIV